MTLSLQMIHSRCDEEADCLIWKGSVGGTCAPYAWHNGKSVNVRRLVVSLSKGVEVPRNMLVTSKCGNSLCLNPKHLILVSKAELNRRIADSGATRTQKALAGRIAAIRAASKLSMEVVDEIRASTEPVKVLADRHGICLSHVYNIKRGVSWSKGAISQSSVFAWAAAHAGRMEEAD